MKQRYIVMIIDEGWPSFYLTEDEELFELVERAASRDDDEGVMDALYGDKGLSNKFENVQEITGVTVLGLVHAHAF